MGKKKKQYEQDDADNSGLPDHDLAPKRRRADGRNDADAAPQTNKKAKLSKKERKELRRQQAENEKRLVAEGAISPRVKYAPRSFLWNILAVCLAFFMGIFFCIGAIVYAGAKSSLKTLLGLVGVEYGNLVTEEYAEKSLIDLFHDLTATEFVNLNSLGKYTPLLGNTLNGLNEQLGVLGVHLNMDELMNVDFGEIGSYFQDNVIKSIRLGETLGLTPDSSPLMIAVCYGTEGEDFDVVDGAFQMKEGKHATTISDLTEDATGLITRVTVEAALNTGAGSPAAIRYLAYGSEGETYDIVDGEIVMRRSTVTGELFPKKTLNSITAEGSDVIGEAKIGDLIDLSEADNFMSTIKEWHINDLTNSNRINRLKISQIINTEDSTSLMMNAIKDWRISDLLKQDKINSLCIGDVLTIDESSPGILRALQDATLGGFGDAVNGIRLCDFLDDNLENNKFLRSLQKSTLATLASDINNLTVADIFGEEIYAYSSWAQIHDYRGASDETFDTYKDFIAYYETTGKDNQAFSGNRPAKIKPDANTLEKRRIHTGDDTNTALTAGWFTADGDGFRKVNATNDDTHVEKTGDGFLRYVEEKQTVTPFYTWKRVDYEKSESEWETVTVAGGADGFVCTLDGQSYPVSTDGFGYYISAPNEKGVYARMDLEREISGYRLLNGTVLPEDTPVRYQKPIGTDAGYYYAVQRVYVEERYYAESAPSQSYAPENTTEIYFGTWTNGSATHTQERLERYLDGIWYLLLKGNGENTRLTELSGEITTASTAIDKTELWELYIHNLISVNMYRELPLGGKNLNQFTLANALEMLASGSISGS